MINRVDHHTIKESEEENTLMNLINKINGILKSKIDLESLVENQKVVFGFTSQRDFVMLNASDQSNGIVFEGGDWNGKYELSRPQVFSFVKSTPYTDVVETQLTTEEKENFNKEGFIPSFPNKSIKNLINDGSILLILDRTMTPSIMSFERLNINSGYSQGESVACQSLKSFDKLGDEIPAKDILFVDSGGNKSKKICNGGVKISNNGIAIKLHSPFKNILDTNR